MKPFLQIRKAIKRNASFDSDDVRTSLLNLLDCLEQDVADAPDEDNPFSHNCLAIVFLNPNQALGAITT